MIIIAQCSRNLHSIVLGKYRQKTRFFAYTWLLLSTHLPITSGIVNKKSINIIQAWKYNFAARSILEFDGRLLIYQWHEAVIKSMARKKEEN